jgi:C-8 sterol isomerase
MFETVRIELEQKYPGRINDKIQWMFNNAGGCMYSVAVLHASLREYLLIFGSPIGTQGHTGRHFTQIYDFVIDGELWYFKEDRPFERIVHKSGDRYHLGKSQSEGLCIPNQAWVLEYARGFIPSMLPFGLADSVFSTLDWKTVGYTFGIYGKLLLKDLWNKTHTNSRPSASKEMP